MSERVVPFSLLDAARVVARGGGLDQKLEALSAQARDAVDAADVAILLHDADAGLLLSFDGLVALPTDDVETELAGPSPTGRPWPALRCPRSWQP